MDFPHPLRELADPAQTAGRFRSHLHSHAAVGTVHQLSDKGHLRKMPLE